MLRRAGRLATSLALTASVSLIAAAGAGAAAISPQQQLVQAYAPILKLREQTDTCDRFEEQFSPPTSVDAVLGNPRVTLVHYVDGQDIPVKQAPTATGIAGLDQDYYLDLPGDPLDPQCTYATDYKHLKAEGLAPSVTYAHIATELGHPGLVVQYWFFYYFNQFNDIHEGDWEGMQISFDANSPSEALADGPSQVALFQHAGGERADWDDTRVQKEGNHPIVYPAAGSHATFYDNAIYIENGSHGSGVGCDNTSTPLQQAKPTPVLVPSEPALGSPAQWLTYIGHWGQREEGFNNGPQGPITKRQWRQPFSWMEDIRQDSPRLPGGAILGPAPATAFCSAIEGVSGFINLKAKTTFGAIGLGVGLILLILIPASLTRWRPVDLSTLRHQWTFGQLVRGARQLYGRHWRTMLLIALSGFLILGAIQGLQYLFEQVTGSNDFTVGISPPGFDLKFGGSFGGIAHPIGGAIVTGAVVAFMRELEEGEEAGFVAAYRAMYQRLWRVVAGQLLATVLVVAMLFTVVGIPFGVYFYIAWQFVQQEILFEDRSIREALRSSHARVRGHWWRTVLVAGFLFLIGVITGPVLGFFLIFANLSAVLVNLIGSVVYALLIPYIAIGRTLLYFDLGAREAEGEAPGRRRRLRLRRPRPAAGTS